MKVATTLLFAGLALATCLRAQNLQGLTLREAVATALQQKPQLKTYAFDEQISAAREEELRQKQRFQLSGKADVQFNPILPASVIPIGKFIPNVPSDATSTVRFGTLWQNGLGINASQVLYDPSVPAQLKEQAFQRQVIGADREKAGNDIVLEVIRAYYAVLIADEELRFAEADSARARQFYKETVDRKDGGKALQTDVNQAALSLNNAELSMERVRLNRQNLRKALCFRMGVSPDNAATLQPAETLRALLDEVRRTGLPGYEAAVVEKNRIELKQLQLDSDLQRLKIATEKTRTAPTLTANAFLGLNNLTNDVPFFASNAWFGNGFVSVNLKVPISEYWQVDKYLPKYQLRQQQDAVKAEELRQQFRFDYDNAESIYRLAARTLETRQRDMDIARQNIGLLKDRLKEGVLLASAVTDAETTLQQLQYAYLQSAYNLLLATLDVKRVRGELQEGAK